MVRTNEDWIKLCMRGAWATPVVLKLSPAVEGVWAVLSTRSCWVVHTLHTLCRISMQVHPHIKEFGYVLLDPKSIADAEVKFALSCESSRTYTLAV